MNLFRSEEHLQRWLGSRAAGASMSAAKLGELAHAWWGDRFSPDWTPHTREQNQAILDRLGLTEPFWQLP
jgi:hypothetical protein